jgi:hypothetical protein
MYKQVGQESKTNWASAKLWYKDAGSGCCGCGDGASKYSVVQKPGARVQVLGVYKRSDKWDDDNW